jgi:Recombination endonuclease VII
MKKCPQCQQVKPHDQFHRDATKACGLVSRCRDCANARSKAYYQRRGGEKHRARYQANRSARIALNRTWRQANLERARERDREYQRSNRSNRRRNPDQERIRYLKRHGGIDEWARLYEAQDGRCYLCGRPLDLDDKIAVDHDHECHPSTRARTESCGDCRRGLTHAVCNQLIGMVGEDMDLLRTIAANFEPVNAAAKARIASRKASVESLFLADDADLRPAGRRHGEREVDGPSGRSLFVTELGNR